MYFPRLELLMHTANNYICELKYKKFLLILFLCMFCSLIVVVAQMKCVITRSNLVQLKSDLYNNVVIIIIIM